MKKNSRCIRFLPLLVLVFIFAGCTGLPRPLSEGNPLQNTLREPVKDSGPKALRDVWPNSGRYPFSRVHSFYIDLLLPLELIPDLSLTEKYDLIHELFGCADQPLSIPDYYSRGDLLIRSDCHPDHPPHILWTSNAVFSPIDKAPLRGTGEFLPEDSNPGNIRGIILMKDGFAVRLADIYSRDAAEYYLRNHSYNNLADLYLHDGIPDNDALILPLLEKADAAAPNPGTRFVVELTRIQYFLSQGSFDESRRRLELLAHALPATDKALRAFYRYTYEEYALTRTMAAGKEDFLVEYDSFMKTLRKMENTRGDEKTGGYSGN